MYEQTMRFTTNIGMGTNGLIGKVLGGVLTSAPAAVSWGPNDRTALMYLQKEEMKILSIYGGLDPELVRVGKPWWTAHFRTSRLFHKTEPLRGLFKRNQSKSIPNYMEWLSLVQLGKPWRNDYLRSRSRFLGTKSD